MVEPDLGGEKMKIRLLPIESHCDMVYSWP